MAFTPGDAPERITFTIDDGGTPITVITKRLTGKTLDEWDELAFRHEEEVETLKKADDIVRRIAMIGKDDLASANAAILAARQGGAAPDVIAQLEAEAEKLAGLYVNERNRAIAAEADEYAAAIKKRVIAQRKCERRHIYEAARFIIDPGAGELTEQQCKKIASKVDGAWWQSQDIEPLAGAVEAFRKRAASK
jgi:hypothetical protein